MDFDPSDPLRSWPNRPPSQDEMNFLVRQEMSNLKALKRLSIGSSGIAAQDPDLPGLDVSESVVNGTAGDVEGDSPPRFARQASITKQRSIKRERSVVSIRRNRRERGSASGASDHDATSRDANRDTPHGGFQASSPQAAPSSEDISNIWVPAGVHPELAPNEWQEFVTEKLAAIRNSHEAQQQSRLSRNSSRLSRVVVAPEEYVDAAIILDKRRKSSNVDKRRSILELSKDFEKNSHNDPMQRAPSFRAASVFLDDADLGVQVSSEPDMDQPLVPLAFGAERGATSLRRSTHRLHKPALRSLSQTHNERPVPPPHTHQHRPEQHLPREGQHPNHSHSHPNPSHPNPSHSNHPHSTHLHSTHPRPNHSHANHPHPHHPHQQHPQQQHQHQLQFQQEHQRLTSNKFPHNQGHSQSRSQSQSQSQQAQRGPGSIYGPSQQIIRDTPQRAIRSKPAESSNDTDPASRSESKMKPPLSISVSAAKALAQTAEQPPSPSAATPSPTASVMLGYRRRKRADGEPVSRPLPDSPEDAAPSDTQGPGGETSIQLPNEISHESQLESHRESQNTPAVSPSPPHVIETSPEEIPERDPSRPVTRQLQEHTKRRSAEVIPQALKRRLGSEHKEVGDSRSDENVKGDENVKSNEASKSDRRWHWLDSPKKDRADPSKEIKENKESKDSKKTFANLFKKRDAKKDSKKEKSAHAKDSKFSSKDYKDQKADSKAEVKTASKSEPKDKTGSSRDSHKIDAAGVSDSMRTVQPITNSRQKGHARAYSRIANDALPQDEANNDDSEDPAEGLDVAKVSATEIQLPYEIPAHQVSDRSHVMMYHRFPLHIERAIYRLSHMKLANPRRPLRQQVLLSNFMYAYLNVVNKSFQEQQMAQLAEQQEKRQKLRGPHGSVAQPFGSLGDLEESQIEQLRRIETHSYEDGLYASGGDEDDTSSSSDDEGEAQRHEAVSV